MLLLGAEKNQQCFIANIFECSLNVVNVLLFLLLPTNFTTNSPLPRLLQVIFYTKKFNILNEKKI